MSEPRYDEHGKPLCAATTKRGTPCRARALPNGTLCQMHDPTVVAQAQLVGRLAADDWLRTKRGR